MERLTTAGVSSTEICWSTAVDCELEVDLLALAYGEGDSGAVLRGEAVELDGDGVGADRDGGGGVAAVGAGGEVALVAGLVVVDEDLGVGEGGSGGVGDGAGEGSADYLGVEGGEGEDEEERCNEEFSRVREGAGVHSGLRKMGGALAFCGASRKGWILG